MSASADVTGAAEPIEAARPPSQQATNETAEDDTAALNRRTIQRVRETVGLDALPEPEQRAWVSALQEAGRGTEEQADALALSVKAQPRPLSDTEHAALVLRAAKLQDEHEGTVTEIERLIEQGEEEAVGPLRARADALLSQLDTITEASDLSGREAARSLSIRRMRLNREAYDLASVLRHARAMKGAGLTRHEEAALRERVQELEAVERRVQELEAVAAEAEAKERQRQAGELFREAKRREMKGEEAEAERAAIKEQLRGLGVRVNSLGGATSEGAYLLGRLALTYAKESPTLESLVRRVRADVPDVTEADVLDAMRTEAERRDPARIERGKERAAARIEGLREEGRLLSGAEGATDPDAVRASVRSLKAALLDSDHRTGDVLQRAFAALERAEEQAGTDEGRATLSEARSVLDPDGQAQALEEAVASGEIPPDLLADPTGRTVPEALERARTEASMKRREVRSAVRSKRPRGWKDNAREAVQLPRALLATADMSYALRQGVLLSARRPGLALDSFGKAFRAFFSEYEAERIDRSIREHPNQHLRERAGLYLATLDGSMHQREELFVSNLAERIPLVGSVVKASERNMVAGLNLLRSGAFDAFLESHPEATDAQLRAFADYVNVASGRGDLGSFTGAATTLSMIFFAPRFAVSRFQAGTRLLRYVKEEPTVAKEIAKDWAAFVGSGLTVLSLASLAGAEVGDDPRDSDFGKIVIGPTRIDLWGGFVQPARLLSRIVLGTTDRMGVTGEGLTDAERRVDPLDLALTFGQYKLAPTVTIPAELISGRSVIGEEREPLETVARSVTPILLQEVHDAATEAGLGTAAGVGALGFVGVSSGVYDDPLKHSDVKPLLDRARYRPGAGKADPEAFRARYADVLRELVPEFEGVEDPEALKEALREVAADVREEVGEAYDD